jgi:hypothetical protein
MKKHRYSAENIKQADWTTIRAQTSGRRIVFGVDVAKDDFFGVLMQEDLTVRATLKWKHPEQTRELAAHLIEKKNGDTIPIDAILQPWRDWQELWYLGSRITSPREESVGSSLAIQHCTARQSKGQVLYRASQKRTED